MLGAFFGLVSYGIFNHQAPGLVGFGFLIEGLKLFWNFRLNIGAFINAYTPFFLFFFVRRGEGPDN